MWGRGRSPVQQAGAAMSDKLGDVKTTAKINAAKGAGGLALRMLGNKAADVVRGDDNADGSKMMAKVAGTVAKQAARKKAGQALDMDGKAGTAGNVLQMIGKRASEVTENVTTGGLNIQVDPNDVPRVLRGVALIATGVGTIFAPGSALDVSHVEGESYDEIAEQARQGLDVAGNLTQQRIKDLVDVAKDALATLSDSLREGIDEAESRAQQTLEVTEARLTDATGQAVGKAKAAAPQPARNGGTMRWLVWGVLLGGLAAFLASPYSGQVGERINAMRRDLGLGGDQSDDSQYWPNTTQETSSDTAAGDQAASFNKTESWKESSATKENSDKG